MSSSRTHRRGRSLSRARLGRSREQRLVPRLAVLEERVLPACLILPKPHLADLPLSGFQAPDVGVSASLNAGMRGVNVGDITAGIDGFALNLEASLKNLNLTLGSIPVIGAELPKVTLPAIDTIEAFRVNLDLDLQNLYADVTLPSIDVGARIQGMLFDVFGPNGLNILMDGPDSGNTIDTSDIYLSSGSDWEQFDMHIGQSYHTDLPLDLSAGGGGSELAKVLPGINLQVAANNGIRAAIQWDLHFGFGFTTHISSAGTGFYFNSGARENVTGDATPELSAQLNVSAAPPKDAAGNDVPSNAPGLQASAQIGFLQGSISDGTARLVQVTSRYAMETNCTDDPSPYSADFNLLVTRRNGNSTTTSTYHVTVDPTTSFGAFLAELNVAILSKVNVSVAPTFLPASASNTEIAANLVVLARDPDVIGLAIQGGESLGFDNGTQYEDGRSMSLGFTDGQSTNTGAITATYAAPPSGILAEDTRFSLLIGGTTVPVVLHANTLDHTIGGLASSSNYHSDQTSLQDALKAAIDYALSQSGFPTYVSTVTLGSDGRFRIALADSSLPTTSISFSMFVSTTETTHFSISASVDLVSPSYDPTKYVAADEGTFDRLYFTQFLQAKKNGSLGSIVVPSIVADGQVRLHTTLQIASQSVGIGGGSLGMPKIDFDLAWNFSATASFDLGQRKGARAIQVGDVFFNHVMLDTGAIISTILTPVVGTLGKLVGPLSQIIGAGSTLLNKDLTVVDWLRGNGPNSLATLLPFGTQLDEIFDTLSGIAGFAKNIKNIDLTKPVSLGDWEYVVHTTDPVTGNPDPLSGKLVPSELAMAADSASQTAASFMAALGSLPGFKFDLFDPSNVSAMLAGQTFKIMEYALPAVAFSKSFSLGTVLTFENDIASTQITVSGSIGLNVNLQPISLVYDSTGLQEFVAQARAGRTPKLTTLLDGVYLTVPDGHAIDVGFSMSGSASAVVGLDTQIGSGSISAGLSGDVFLDLLDPVNHDGELRLGEIFALTNNFSDPAALFSLFNVGASLDANLSFDLSVAGIDVDKLLNAIGIPTSYSISAGITTSQIFGSMSQPAPKPLALASEVREDGGTALVINAGPLASQRLAGNQDDSAGYKVTVSGGNGNVSVTLAGKTQTFTGNYNKVVVLGGPGADTIDLSGLSGIPAVIDGGGGNDVIKGGSGGNTIDTGDGNVTVTGGSGIDVITGGAGTDTIKLGGGTSTVTAGSGRLVLTDGTGNATIDASASLYPLVFTALGGSHTITGTNNGDTITLGSGTNTVSVGAGGATIYDGTGHNTIDYRGSLTAAALVVTGTDTVYGSNDDDVISASGNGVITYYGGSGNATLTGGSGDDTFRLGSGSNTVVTGGGNNTVVDGMGDDYVNASANASGFQFTSLGGRDSVIGSAFADTLVSKSAAGATFYGMGGDDSLKGGPGPDYLDGGTGTDSLTGQGGDDTLVAPMSEIALLDGGGGVTTYILDGTSGIGLTIDSKSIAQGTNKGSYKAGDHIVVTLSSGNDTVTLTNANAFVTLLLGGGNDAVTATNLVGSLDATSGTGNDTFTLSGINGPVTLNPSTGTNTVTATNVTGNVTINAVGTDTASLSNIIGNLNYTGTNNANTLTVTNLTGTTTVNTSVGVDSISLTNATGAVTINSGTGADTVTLDKIVGAVSYQALNGGPTLTVTNLKGNLTAGFGTGKNTVSIADAAGNVALTTLGSAANSLALTRVAGTTLLTTGSGNDALTLTDLSGPSLTWNDAGTGSAASSKNTFTLTNTLSDVLQSVVISTLGNNNATISNLTGTLGLTADSGNLTLTGTTIQGAATVTSNASKKTGTIDSITLTGLSAGLTLTDSAANSTSIKLTTIAGTAKLTTDAGLDSFDLNGFSGPLTVAAGGGGTNFKAVGLSGATTLSFGGGTSTIDFSNSTGNLTVTGTDDSSSKVTTTLSLGSATQTVTVGLGDGADQLTVNPGKAGTIAYSTGSGQSTAFINGQTGTVNITFGSNGDPTKPNSVTDYGNLGTLKVIGGKNSSLFPNTKLTIDRSLASGSQLATFTSLSSGTSQGINLGTAVFNATGLSGIELDLGPASDTVNIQSTSTSIPIVVYTGDGNDIVSVSSVSFSTTIIGSGNAAANGPGNDSLTLKVPSTPVGSAFGALAFNVQTLTVDNSNYASRVDWYYDASTLDLGVTSGVTRTVVVNTSGARAARLEGGTNTGNTLSFDGSSVAASQQINVAGSLVDLTLASTVLSNPTFSASGPVDQLTSTSGGNIRFVTQNATPFLTRITPASALKNSDDLTVNLFGAFFSGASAVYLGTSTSPLTTVYKSSTWLQATIPASSLQTARSTTLKIRNGSIDSITLPFTITAGSSQTVPTASTGENLALGSIDPNWTLVGNDLGPNAYVTPISGKPAAWIGPAPTVAGTFPGLPSGLVKYSTTIDLSGYDASTVVLRASVYVTGTVTDIRLNGVSLGLDPFRGTTPGGDTTQSAAPAVISSGLLPGLNSLTFVVKNLNSNNALYVDLAGTTGNLVGTPVSQASFLSPPTPSFGPEIISASASSTILGMDLNRDGQADVVTITSSQVTINRSNGDGTFHQAQTFSVTNALSGAIGDFNGDGLPDIFVGTTSGFYLFKNFVTNTFTMTGPFQAGLNLANVLVGDFDKDGNQDVWGNPAGSPTLYFLKGTGIGTFATATSKTLSVTPASIAAADFNGDGVPDLVASDSGSARILRYTGVATTGLVSTTGVATLVTPSAGETLAVGDLDGDGKRDVSAVDASAGTLSVFLGNGDGTFDPATNVALADNGSAGLDGFLLADLYGTGDLDPVIITNGDVQILVNDGTGHFSGPVLVQHGAASVSDARVADVDGDGRPDLILAGSVLDVLLNTTPNHAATAVTPPAAQDGTLTYTSSSVTGIGKPKFVTAGDFNNDGIEDLASYDASSGKVYLSPGNGDGSFGTPTSFTAAGGTGALQILSADLRAVGKLDIVLLYSDHFEVYLGRGDGTFGSAKTNTASLSGESYLVARLDTLGVNDAYPEMIIGEINNATNTTGRVLEFPGNGDGTFGTHIAAGLGSGEYPFALSTYDMNNDGKDEVVALTHDYIYIMHGNTNGMVTTAEGFQLPIGNSTYTAGDLAVANLDGNSKADFLIDSYEDGNVYQYNNVFTYKSSSDTYSATWPTPTYLSIGGPNRYDTGLIVGDFNKDGQLDAAASFGTSLYVYTNSGGTLQPGTVYTVPNSVTSFLQDDLDADGYPDLIAGSNSTGGIRILKTLGTTAGLSSLSPSSASRGPGSLSVTLTGSGFTTGSVVYWNGAPLTTTYGSANSLSVVIPAGGLDHPGTTKFWVQNTTGAISGSINFTINDVFATSVSRASASMSFIQGVASDAIQLGSFTELGGDTAASEYIPTISWGDGTTSTGFIAPLGSNKYSVLAKDHHAYASTGSFTVTVTLRSFFSGATSTFTITANVSAETIQAGATDLTAVAGQALSAEAATFTDKNPYLSPSDYDATIDWGDGTVTDGLVVGSGGSFSVIGTHIYASKGTNTVSVTITQGARTPVVVTSTAYVNPALPFVPNARQAGTNIVTFPNNATSGVPRFTAFSPDASSLAVIDTANNLNLYNFSATSVSTLATLSGLPADASVYFSPDGAHLYIVSPTSSKLSEYLVPTTAGTFQFERDNTGRGNATAMLVSSDMSTAYVARDGQLIVYSITSTGGLVVLQSFTQGVGGVDGLNDPTTLQPSDDGKTLLVGSSTYGTLASFSIGNSGKLTFVDVVDNSLVGLSDIASRGEYVFALLPAEDAIAVFSLAADGTLSFLQRLRQGVGGATGLATPTSLRVVPVVGGAQLQIGSVGDAFNSGGTVLYDIATTVPDPTVVSLDFKPRTVSHAFSSLSVVLGSGGDVATLSSVVTKLTLTTGSGGDVVTVASTLPSSSTTINLGSGTTAGNDVLNILQEGTNSTLTAKVAATSSASGSVFNVQSTATGATTSLTGGSAADTFNVDWDHLDSRPTINPGATGTALDTLHVTAGPNDVINTPTPATPSGTLTNSSGGGSGVSYAGIKTLVIDAGPKAEAGGPYTIAQGSSLTLSGVNSLIPAGHTATYGWAFDGDGNYADAAGLAPTLTWSRLIALGLASQGTHSVSLRVVTDEGYVGYDSATINISANPAMSAAVTGATTTASDVTLNLTAVDPNPAATISLWTVQWGDGLTDTYAGNAPTATHRYALNGSYGIAITAVDDNGTKTSADDLTYTLNPPSFTIAPATLNMTGPSSVVQGQAYQLTLNDVGIDLGSWTVTWGDGSTSTLTGSPLDDTATLTHVYTGAPSSRTITATVHDSVHNTNLTLNSVAVTVNVAEPTLSVSAPTSVAENSPFNLSLLQQAAAGFGNRSIAWSVNWGDTTTSTLTSSASLSVLSHIYASEAPDQASFVVTVNASDAGVPLLTKTLSVSVFDVAPTLTISGNTTATRNSPYTLNLATVAGGDPITGTSIDWGDGTVATFTGAIASATHVYTTGGVHIVSASVTNDDGTYSSGNTIGVDALGVAPGVSISGAATAVEGSPYVLALSGTPGSDAITSWTVDWGDGTTDTLTGNPGSAAHVYTDESRNIINAWVNTDFGTYAAVARLYVQAVDDGPTSIGISGPSQVVQGDTVTTTLSATSGYDPILGYVVNWGDGTSSEVTGNSASHVYAGYGTRTVTAAARTSDGLYPASAGLTIAVAAAPPIVSISAPASVDQGTPFFVDLGVALPPGASVTGWTIDWGDGSAVQNFDPSTLTAGHVYVDGGLARNLLVTATRDGGLTGSASSTVLVNDLPPTVSVSGYQNVFEGSTYTLNLSAVDIGTHASEQIGGWSVDWGDGTVQSITGNPSAVTHVYADGGAWSRAPYTVIDPVSGLPRTYSGTVATTLPVIRATAYQGTSGHAAAPLTVGVLDVAPTIAVSGDASVAEGDTYHLNLGAISDPGTDVVSSYVIDWGDGVSESFSGNPTSTSHTHVYDDGAGTTSRTIRVRLTDEDGTHVDGGSTKTNVLNVAPTALLTTSGAVYGAAASASLTGPYDPSSADTAAGFRFAFSVDVDTTGTATYAGSSSVGSTTFAGLSAGVHTLYARIVDKDGGFTPYSSTFRIDKAQLTVKANSPTKTYDGLTFSAFTTSISGFVNGESPSVVSGSPGFSGPALTAASAGAFAVTPTLGTLSAANYDFVFVAGTLTITKANLTVTADAVSKVFDGLVFSPFTAAYSGFVNGENASVVAGTPGFVGAATTAVDVGLYTVTPTVGSLSAANYDFTTFRDGSLTVTKAGSTVQAFGDAFTYDGTTHLGGSAVVTGPGVITGSAVLTYVGDQVDAGSYTVVATYAGDLNHTGSTASAVITIAKADASIVVTPYTVTYDGQSHTATGTAKGIGGVALTGLDLSGTTHTNAGSTSDTWRFTDVTGNYNDATGLVSDVIKRADATVTVNGYSGTYDGLAHGATGSASGVGGVDLSAFLNLGSGFTNAPGGTASWTFSGGTNYNDQSGSVSITIAKADASIVVTPYTVTYDGQSHTATGTAKGIGGVALLGLDLSGTTHTNAGSTSDKWRFTDVTGNYNDSTGIVADLIRRADATVTVNGYSGIYDGLSHGATGSASGVGGVDLSAFLNLGSGFTNAPGGTASWTFSGGTNYNDQSGSVAIMIGKAEASIVVTPYTVTYDGRSHSATGTAKGVDGIALTGLDLSGTTHTNAGSTSDTWRFTDVTGNYNDASGLVSDLIRRADATVSVNGYTGTYDSLSHGATGTATGVGGVDLSGTLNLGARFSNAPGGTASWTFSGGTNYNDQSGSVAIVIGKADASIVVTPYSVTYDGLAHTATGTAKGIGGVALTGLDLSGTTHTNAGSTSDTWRFTDVTGNYNDSTGIVADLIRRADATVTVNGYSGTYDGLAHGATGSASGVGGVDLSAFLNLGAAFTNAPGGTASWTFSGGTNYNDQSGSVAIVIGKADASIVVTPYMVTYDGQSHTATGTAKGIGGVALMGLDLSGTTHTNAGSTTDTWRFTDVTGNYNDASGLVSDLIRRADATVSVNGYTGTYDGLSHGATGTATGVGGVDLSGTLILGARFTNAPGGTASWTFSGGTNYNDQSGSVAITIAKADASIVVTPYSVTYDGLVHTATGTAKGIGGVNLSAGLSLGGTTHAGAGLYATDAWTFHDPSGNYADASGTVGDVIARAALTVTANDATKVFGTPNPTFSASYAGLVGGDTVAALGGTLTFTTTAAADSPVGTYPITPGGLTSANYAITFVPGVLRVVTNTDSVYVLNPSLTGAVTISGNASINLPGDLVVDSNASGAILATGNAVIKAATVQVVGGVVATGNARVTKTGTPSRLGDPLSGLSAPVVPSYGVSVTQTISGNTVAVINPGAYTRIAVSGNARVTLNPGVYVIGTGGIAVSGNGVLNCDGVTFIIQGGGLSVTGNGGIAGNGVLIYNAAAGASMGGITLSGNGTIRLSPASSGPDAGILIDQPSSNTRALSISGNAMMGVTGTIHAPAALLTMSGNGSLKNSLVVDSLNLSGNVALTQLAGGDLLTDGFGVAATLLAGDLNLYVVDTSGFFTPEMRARIQDAIAAWDSILGPYNVNVREVDDPSQADVILVGGGMSAAGGVTDGVLGCYNPGVSPAEITIVQAWNWFAGADETSIDTAQYDFQTTVTHELGHALGLGHSLRVESPMFETLPTGTARRVVSEADLNIAPPHAAPDPQLAAREETIVSAPEWLPNTYESAVAKPVAAATSVAPGRYDAVGGTRGSAPNRSVLAVAQRPADVRPNQSLAATYTSAESTRMEASPRAFLATVAPTLGRPTGDVDARDLALADFGGEGVAAADSDLPVLRFAAEVSDSSVPADPAVESLNVNAALTDAALAVGIGAYSTAATRRTRRRSAGLFGRRS